MDSRQWFLNSFPLFLDRDVELLADFRWRYTKLPIIVKGVQSIEYVELCVKHGAEGVMIVRFTDTHGNSKSDTHRLTFLSASQTTEVVN